jgi:hypothetical protein
MIGPNWVGFTWRQRRNQSPRRRALNKKQDSIFRERQDDG